MLLFCGDPSITSDAVAEAFAQGISGQDRIRDRRRWVWRSAFRIAGREAASRRDADPLPADPAQTISEVRSDILEALLRLSPKQRACVVLHYYGGYPAREIAALIGSTTGAVWVHLSNGRKQLRVLLEVERIESA